jgi:tetratricopeptide (TPR) repeat protein
LPGRLSAAAGPLPEAAPDGTGPGVQAGQARYRAFVSYSHADRLIAAQLHRAVETYAIPSKLVGRVTAVGEVPRRLTPIFRDRDELPVSGDLGAELHAALDGSMFLIVICSKAAAKSRWVGEEIKYFKRRHGESRVLALVVDGEPGAADVPGREDEECFPDALKFHIGPDGELTRDRAEPLAADIRPHADGRRLARMKLIAGLTGLRLDDLVQREAQRRTERLALVTAGALAGMVLTGALALYANAARIEANKQRKSAEVVSDYLANTFELADPGKENPRTITALKILERGGANARRELAGQPEIQARLMGVLGRAYNRLGAFKEAQAVFEPLLPQFEAAGPDGAEAVINLADTYANLSEREKALAMLARAEALLGPDQRKRPDLRAKSAAARGRILTQAADVKGGTAAFDKALAYYRAAPDTPADQVARVYNNRGLLLSDGGQYKAALADLQRALDLYRRSLGEDHVKTGQTWFALAQTSFQAGDLAAAESQIRNALRIERKVLDPDNPILADSLSMQGQIYQGQGRLQEGERSLKEAIAIYRRRFGGPHYLIGIADVYLGLIESERGDQRAALAVYDDAKKNYDASYGKLHANHGDLLIYRADALARMGRKAEARADCAKGAEILRQTMGPDSSFTKERSAECGKLG